MTARLIVREKFVFPDGDLVEIVVWEVPEPVPPTTHGFRYRLAYIRAGERVIGYDNERGKGDHRHFQGSETPLAFVSVEALVDAFVAEVEQFRSTE